MALGDLRRHDPGRTRVVPLSPLSYADGMPTANHMSNVSVISITCGHCGEENTMSVSQVTDVRPIGMTDDEIFQGVLDHFRETFPLRNSARDNHSEDNASGSE